MLFRSVGPGATTVSLPRRRPTPQGGLSCSSGAIHLLPTSARLVPGWRAFHVTLFDTCFLVMPPAGPFLSGQKGAKEPVKAGDSDFPRLNNPPLETAKKGELRFPLLGTSPELSYR